MQSIESLLRRDFWISLGALILIIVMTWAWLVTGAGMDMTALEMTRMDPAMAMPAAAWNRDYAVLMFLMWWIMMIAMMLPSAAPVILLAAALNRRTSPEHSPYGSSSCFLTGYLLAWAVFSAVAVIGQWLLQTNGLLTGFLHLNNQSMAGVLLMGAALWQLTPVKQACLRHCRSPVDFLIQRRRPGMTGALRMGAGHGIYCLGCCWFLMLLLFVGGVMNLYWIAALALYVLAEKFLPVGHRISQIAAVILFPAGAFLLLS